MIQSMTGFATRTIAVTIGEEKAHVTLQLKTLNANHIETNYRLPHQLFHLETELIRLFKQQLYRGNIYFTIHIDNQNIFKGNIIPAFTTIERYLNAINAIRTRFDIKESIGLSQILDLPNIFTVEEKSDATLTEAILQATNDVIQAVVQERIREGENLYRDFFDRIQIMRTDILIIEQRSVEMIEEQKIKIKEVSIDSSSSSTESQELIEARQHALFTVLEKINIHEEIVRFKSHLDNLETLIDAPAVEKGTRIDFTLQEIVREVNTMGAKCSDAIISAHVINIKVEIKKAREQAQNII